METAGKLVRVTPQKLQAILDRLEAEQATRLAILGPYASLSADPNDWPEPVRGRQVFQLGEPWPGLVNLVIQLRHLERLDLWRLELGDAGARAIARHLTRLQDEYNRALRDCDIVVSLFKTKVGKFTEEEFDVAWERFKATDKPRIFTFFRSFQLSDHELETRADDFDSLKRLKKKLSDLGHFHTKYNDAEHLMRQFRDQLVELGLLR